MRPGGLTAAPPDDGHRGADTSPDESFEVGASSEPSSIHPPLHRDPARQPMPADVPFAILLAGGLLVVWYLLLGIYLPTG
jgi:hypothetical protein